MEDFSYLTDVLVSMGFDVYDIERAYFGGHKTLESIIDFISGVNVPENDSHGCDRLRLRGAEGTRRTSKVINDFIITRWYMFSSTIWSLTNLPVRMHA